MELEKLKANLNMTQELDRTVPSKTLNSDASLLIPLQKTQQLGSATGNPRNKCALRPGHSLMDWIRLGNSKCDLAGTKGVIRPISHAELADHKSRQDAWLAIRGKCYNVSRYMDFHPGGPDELMKGVGQDATEMFDKVHAWVNYEQILSKCYVGPLINTATTTITVGSKTTSKLTASLNTLNVQTENSGFKMPVATLSTIKHLSTTNMQISASEFIPRFDWIQTSSELIIIFYTHAICNPGFTIEIVSEIDIVIRIFIEHVVHICTFKFAYPVEWPLNTKMSNKTGKIEIICRKIKPMLWTSFGLLERKKSTDISCNTTNEYNIITRVQITHDSYVLLLKPKKNIIQHFPIGFHISLTAVIEGIDCTRSYTPVPLSYLTIPCSATYVPLLVKKYLSGCLSKYLTESNSLTSSVNMSHPKGSFSLGKIKDHTRIAILAAGSGLTPMLSIVDYLMDQNSNNLDAITFLYFNKTESDIWCRDRLEDLSKQSPRIQLKHILSAPETSTWPKEQTGHISLKLMESLTSSTSPNFSTFYCVCGPLSFNDICIKLLQTANIQPNNFHVFSG